jgi:hypothetical protein
VLVDGPSGDPNPPDRPGPANRPGTDADLHTGDGRTPTVTAPEPVRYDAEVTPGEMRHLRYGVGETYLDDPVEIPVTVIVGERGCPTVGTTAAIHGDELNGVKTLQEVADTYTPAELRGTLVCLHVCTVPGYLAQQRYLPIYDQDLTRSFPGTERSNTAERMANVLYRRFVANCDLPLDFHTSTRDRRASR